MSNTFTDKERMPEKVAREYVVGFLIDPTNRRVALIKKDKPAWQKGYWNGIGGKVELREEPKQAMAREFKEEAGAWIEDWNYDRTMVFDNGSLLHVYYLFRNIEIKTMEKEEVNWFSLNHLPTMLPNTKDLIHYFRCKLNAE